MNDALNSLKENFSVLPKELQNVILDPSTRQKIKNFCQKISLSQEQTVKVENEVFFILFGIELFSNFRANLVDKVDLTYDQALKISFEMNSQIFNPILSILKEIEDAAKNGGGEDRGIEDSEILLPDHEELVRTEGQHLHSQNVMPQQSFVKPAASTRPTPPVSPTPVKMPGVTVPPKPAFTGSIVDQKLSGMVRSSATSVAGRAATSSAPSNLPTSEKDLEEMMQKADGVKVVGYKGADPYREPIE